jgi:hypothetical protein
VTTTPPAPTLTVHTTADPCPRVEILISPMPGDVDEITVYRSWLGNRLEVRGGKRAEVAGDFLLVDYEVPLGTPVAYTSVGYDVAGTPSQESSSTTQTVSVAEVWLQDPLDPTTALRAGLTIPRDDLMVVAPSFEQGAYSSDSSRSTVVGSSLAVARMGTRQAATGMPLTIDAGSPTSSAALKLLLDQQPLLCVRPPSTLIPDLGGLAYLAVSSYVPKPYNGWTRTTYSLVGDVVRGPGASIVVSPRTYDDLLDESATYGGLITLYSTYVDLLRGL